eukprot:TRINITY_DN26285_c0_g1_i1.p1 TRINITY_DN26285_c0_g1~~TRINITY_DN26285_c0_g1_i1.p1  ORF type:complete len:174 (+),score=42.78 TRINITY_DN26285_c0_g1_i1:56-523(+)
MMRFAVLLAVASVAHGSFFDKIIHRKSGDDNQAELSVCNHDRDIFKVDEKTGLTVTPYPPKTGEEFTVKLVGDVTKDLTAIKMSIDVHFGFVPLTTVDVDLCEKIHCPIPKGPFTMTKAVTLPSSAPSGHYTISVRGHNDANEEVICGTIKVHIE